MNRRHAILTLAAASFASGVRAEIQPLGPPTERGLRLFGRYGQTPPKGDPVIYVYSQGAHFTAVEVMVIAARDPAGRWAIASLGEETSAMLTVQPKKVFDSLVDLSAKDAGNLDQLLTSPELYQEKDSMAQPPGEGGFIHSMEIVGPSGRLVIRWTGRLVGKAGAIADIVIG